MNDLIKFLKIKYNALVSQQKINKSAENKIMVQIDELISSFDKIEEFDQSDIKDICAMLDKESAIRFKNEERYFKMLNKFPNQPQIQNAKKVIEEIKVILREKVIKDSKEVFNLVSDIEKKIKVLKYYIETIESYDANKYISSYDLYVITTFLQNSDVTDEVIDFYNTILLNNNLLTSKEENDETLDEEYNDFINRVKKINKSMSVEQYDYDKILLDVFNNIINKDSKRFYSKEMVDDLIDYINQYITSEEDKEVVKRIKFLIHLHNVEVDLTKEQLEFVTNLKNFYEERVKSASISEIASKNVELLSYLEDDYKFENVGLLIKIMNAMEIKPIEQLKIISAIVKNNSTKKCNKKLDLSKGIIELFDSKDLTTTYLDEEDISILNSNLENSSEVLTHLIELDYNFVDELSKNEDQVGILIDILMYSSKEIINKISKICKKEDLDLVGLINYSPYVLVSSSIKNCSSGEFDIFCNNIEFCETNGIKPKAIENLLLEETSVLSNRYNILVNLYKLDITGNENILGMEYIISTIDRIIEANKSGYKFVTSNLSKVMERAEDLAECLVFENNILRYDENDEIFFDSQLLDRVKEYIIDNYGTSFEVRTYGKYWNEKLEKLEGLFPWITMPCGRQLFSIPEDYDYIDESLFENKYIAHLENPKNKIKKNDFIYNLDGCYVSRIKFLRACAYLRDMVSKVNLQFDRDAIIYALRFEKLLHNGASEKKIDSFDTIRNENKSKKKKK